MKDLKFKIFVLFLVGFMAISIVSAVDTNPPAVSLSSSAGTILSLGQTTTLACTGNDDVAMQSVNMIIDGLTICSGSNSCSINYVIAAATNKIVTCTALDTFNNSASTSLTLSVAGGGSTGGYINANTQLQKTILVLNSQNEIKCIGDSSQPITNYLIKVTNPEGEQFSSTDSIYIFTNTEALGTYQVNCRVTNNLGVSIDATPKTFEVTDINNFGIDTNGCIYNNELTNPLGLAWDGTSFWYSDEVDKKVYQISTTGSILGSFIGPSGAKVHGLAWDGDYLWIVSYPSGNLYKINTTQAVIDGNTDNAIMSTISSFQSYTESIAYGNSALWISFGSGNNKIYQIDSVNGSKLGEFLSFSWLENRVIGCSWKDSHLLCSFFNGAIDEYISIKEIDTEKALAEGNVNNSIIAEYIPARSERAVGITLVNSKIWYVNPSNGHICLIDSNSPAVSLTSSLGNSFNLGQSTILSCTANDDIAMQSVTIGVDGINLCSGTNSCSGVYTMATSTDKTVSCIATDTSNNIAITSLTLTIPAPSASGGSSGGGGGGGGSSDDDYECIEGEHYTCSEWSECTGQGILGTKHRTCEKIKFCKPYKPKEIEQCTLPVIGVLPPNNPLLPEETTSEIVSENTEEPIGLTSITGRAVSGVSEGVKAAGYAIKETFVSIINFFKNWFK